MEYKIDEAIIKKAINGYGKLLQTFVLFEEMAELQKEVCKVFRGEENLSHCEEEMADVYIMLEQLKIMFNLKEENIQNYIDDKTKRLQRRMDGDVNCTKEI